MGTILCTQMRADIISLCFLQSLCLSLLCFLKHFIKVDWICWISPRVSQPWYSWHLGLDHMGCPVSRGALTNISGLHQPYASSTCSRGDNLVHGHPRETPPLRLSEGCCLHLSTSVPCSASHKFVSLLRHSLWCMPSLHDHSAPVSTFFHLQNSTDVRKHPTAICIVPSHCSRLLFWGTVPSPAPSRVWIKGSFRIHVPHRIRPSVFIFSLAYAVYSPNICRSVGIWECIFSRWIRSPQEISAPSVILWGSTPLWRRGWIQAVSKQVRAYQTWNGINFIPS